ncbi:transposable element Tcb1 transposase [Trichonephila clavipes]|nr:transposable element Tcb1 transposase [Trichonephila clavipes]
MGYHWITPYPTGHFFKIIPDHQYAMDCLTACQILPWPARSSDLSSIEHVWDTMERRLHLPWNVDDLARQLEQIWQETSQETTRVLYHSMPRRVAACIQTREEPEISLRNFYLADNMLYKDETIKITISCNVWMMTKSVVSVAAIVGYNHCHTPRHRIKEALDVSLGYRSPSSFKHIAKVGLV